MGNIFTGIVTRVKQTAVVTSMMETMSKYEEDCKKMTEKEKSDHISKKMDAYKALCLGGLTSVYWKDSTALITKVKTINAGFASFLSTSFAISQVFMLIGLAAASFPMSSPFSEVAASNGSLFAVLSTITAFHLEIIEFFDPKWFLCLWIVLLAVFATYWWAGSQDPTIANLLWTVVCWIWYLLSKLVCWIWYPLSKPVCFLWYLLCTIVWFIWCVLCSIWSVIRYFLSFSGRFSDGFELPHRQ